MLAAYQFKHPNVKSLDSTDFKPTELAKKLFEISPRGQGFVGFVDLLTGDIHLCPVYNKDDGLERKAIMYEGINYAVESMVPLRATNTATVTGGDAHKNARAKLKLMDDKEHSGHLVGFGCQKGKGNSLLESFRNRSASLNLLAIKYNEEYLDLNTRKDIMLRSMPDDITEKTIQALCKELPVADINQERVLKERRLLTPVDCSSEQFKQMEMLPLHHAAALGNLITVKELLSLKQDSVNEVDNAGWTPLMYAASQGRLEVVNELLQVGASIDVKDDAGQTPLMHAASQGRFNVVEALLQAGASVSITDKENQTAVMCAIANRQFRIAGILCKHGSVVTDNLTQLLIAVANRHYTASDAEAVLNNAPANRQETLDLILLEAVKKDDVDLARKLIEKGASPGEPNQKPASPLTLAIFLDHTKMVEALTQRTSPSQDNVAKESASHLNQLQNAAGTDKESSNNAKNSSTLGAWTAYAASQNGQSNQSVANNITPAKILKP